MDVELKKDRRLDDLYTKIHQLQIMEEQLMDIRHKAYTKYSFFEEQRGWFIFMKSATQYIEELRETLRKRINVLSRQHVRQINLLDLPDEILVHICEYVQGRPEYFLRYIPEFNFGVDEVKNMRLTCRKLCTTSSHLLISSIHVDMDATSLSHLDEISRHPLISQGVRVIRLNLLYYDNILGEDLESFSDYHANRLLETTECIEEMSSHDTDFFLGTPKNVVDAAIDKGWKIGHAWIDYSDEDHDTEEDKTYRELLLIAYEKYRKIYLEQERLLQSGTFHRAVASAMARMHKATRLDLFNAEFIGKPGRRRRPDFITMVSNDESLIDSTLFPITWENGRRFDLGEPPQGLIFNLSSAICENGIYLSALDIKVPPSDYYALVADAKNLEFIKTITQRLKYFSYDPRVPFCSGLWGTEDLGEARALENFLCAHLHSRLLNEIQITCDFLRLGPNSPLFSLGRLLTLQSWPELERMSLTGLAFNLSDLEQFISKLHKPVTIWLMRVHLLAGTWAEVLDVLRGKVGNYSTLEDLSGAEFKDLTEEQVKNIMGKNIKSPSLDMNKAERYLFQIFSTSNPFRIDR